MFQGNEYFEQMTVRADFSLLYERLDELESHIKAYTDYTTLRFYMGGLTKEGGGLATPQLFRPNKPMRSTIDMMNIL